MLAGCSSPVEGQAKPGTVPSSSQASGSASPTSDPSNPFASMDPCKLLDQVLAGQGYEPATPDIADPKRSCGTKKGAIQGQLGLALQAGQKIDDNIANPAKAAPAKINGRRSVQEKEPLGDHGDCTIGMEVQSNSRALVLFNSSSKTTDEACAAAQDLALKVEPLLPKN
ncbi:DUF3558 family protein [Amycolatopsis sp. H20-H5]|uniref:DUF3558 family protein n=1 Tax=Amycolatopsis sp. H20-H5 TaxID=3046309 RepID=UPI002DBCC28C|nr:DUF3558 family protein [Amycolatopsis sp. H20-H5]MEC3975075.1 DUF3558 family protein [Amycolatopsis sp. H20-H5]